MSRTLFFSGPEASARTASSSAARAEVTVKESTSGARRSGGREGDAHGGHDVGEVHAREGIARGGQEVMAEDVGVVVGVAAVPGGESPSPLPPPPPPRRTRRRPSPRTRRVPRSSGRRTSIPWRGGSCQPSSWRSNRPRSRRRCRPWGRRRRRRGRRRARDGRARARGRVVIATRRETRRARIAGGAATRAAPEATVRVDVAIGDVRIASEALVPRALARGSGSETASNEVRGAFETRVRRTRGRRAGASRRGRVAPRRAPRPVI